jgi:hypothetical protein
MGKRAELQEQQALRQIAPNCAEAIDGTTVKAKSGVDINGR